MSGLHHELAPSSFPAWAVCPCFDSDSAERADAAEGTAQHAALSAMLSGNNAPLAALSPDAREAVNWAAGYVHTLAGVQSIIAEHRVSFTAPDGFAPDGISQVYDGTADAIIIHPPGNLADLVDYKSGADERDHRPQLAGCALALFSMRTRLKTIRCHVLYGRVRRADSWAMTQADAAATVLPILDARRHPARTPTACDYCTFCAARMTCPAITQQVAAVGETASTWADLALAIRNPGAITDPETASRALTLARFVSTWADAVRARATELAKAGSVLPGYRLQERRGARDVTDLNAAFVLLGLSQEQFVAACKLSFPRLTDAYGQARTMSKARAAQEVENLLRDIIRDGASSWALVTDRKQEGERGKLVTPANTPQHVICGSTLTNRNLPKKASQ
jgi:hypothetical protein